MCLVRLKDACHYSTLDEEIGEPGDRQRIEEVHLEEGLVADMITVEWNTLDKGNMRDKYRGVGVVGIASVRTLSGPFLLPRTHESQAPPVRSCLGKAICPNQTADRRLSGQLGNGRYSSGGNGRAGEGVKFQP